MFFESMEKLFNFRHLLMRNVKKMTKITGMEDRNGKIEYVQGFKIK